MTKGHRKTFPSFLITAGPTREYLDPVRFLSNPSTGKMGFSLALAAKPYASKVTLCLGPVGLETAKGFAFKPFGTADELMSLVKKEMKDHDILIMTSAVSDYRPAAYSPRKMKKKGEEITVKLKKNPDILKTVSRLFRKKHKFLIGFAAETHHLTSHALQKMKEKEIPMIIANRVYKEKKGFSSDKNEVRVFTRGKNKAVSVLTGTKKDIAKRLFPIIIEEYTQFINAPS